MRKTAGKSSRKLVARRKGKRGNHQAKKENKKRQRKQKKMKTSKNKGKRGTEGKEKGKRAWKGMVKGKRGRGKVRTINQNKLKTTSNNHIGSLTIEEIRDYKWAMNQKRKALRVQGWFSVLGKKFDKSRVFFVEAAEFFKDCPEGSAVYKHLR